MSDYNALYGNSFLNSSPEHGITSGLGNTAHSHQRNGYSTTLSPSPQPLSHPGRGASVPHAHEAKRLAALQSGGLGVANPRKNSFCSGFFAAKPQKVALRNIVDGIVSWWGVCVFRLRRKTQTPHSKGEREGTWFPHTPAGETF
jgi:hypothetical protein